MDKKTLKRLLVGDFSLKRCFRSVIFIYACVGIYGYFFSDRLIFQPQPATYQDTPATLKLKSKSGTLISALYLANKKATHTIIYSHGNAEDLGDVRPYLEALQHMGFAVLAYDYQGYGTSQGTPSEDNAYADINAAYDYLTQNLGVSPAKIIIYGRSVGSGPSVDLATRKKVAGLVIESGFVSAFRVRTIIPIFPFDKFANIDKINRVNCPVLVLHGMTDQVIPFWHGQALFEKAKQPKHYLWVKAAGHNDVMDVAGKDYEKTLREFSELVKGQLAKPVL